MKKIKLFGLIFSLVLAGGVLASCGDKGNSGNGGDVVDPQPDKPGEFIDYFNNDEAVRLNRDYKGRDFWTDGIAEMKVSTFIDGDTTHFNQLGDTTYRPVKIRYYGVDTPESTSEVQEYGQRASDFTKSQLKAAKTIVVSSSLKEYGEPETDSTGSRYLGMVWISPEPNADYKDLRLLNLLIVQEGLSTNKGLANFPDFKDTFENAEAQAREFKKNMFSGEPDPDFNYGDYEKTSLFSIQKAYQDVVEGRAETNIYNNKKVRIIGTVAGYTNKTLYLQSRKFNEETGKEEFAGINLFNNSNIDSEYSALNTQLELSALCKESEEFGFQLVSVHGGFPFIPNEEDPNRVIVLNTPEESIEKGFQAKEFDLSANELDRNFDYVNSYVRVQEEFLVTGARNPLDPGKRGGTLFLQNTETGKRPPMGCFLAIAFDPTPEDPDDFEQWNVAEDYIGSTIKISGIYTVRKKKQSDGYVYEFQITPRMSTDITLVKRAK